MSQNARSNQSTATTSLLKPLENTKNAETSVSAAKPFTSLSPLSKPFTPLSPLSPLSKTFTPLSLPSQSSTLSSLSSEPPFTPHISSPSQIPSWYNEFVDKIKAMCENLDYTCTFIMFTDLKKHDWNYTNGVYRNVQYRLPTGFPMTYETNDNADYLYITFTADKWMYVNAKKFWLQLYDSSDDYLEGWKADHFTIGFAADSSKRILNIHRTHYNPTETPYIFKRQRPLYCNMLLDDILEAENVELVRCYISKTKGHGQSILREKFTQGERDRLKLLFYIGLGKKIQGGGGSIKYKGRRYKVRTGPKGGKYIIAGKEKVYLKAKEPLHKGGFRGNGSSVLDWNDPKQCTDLYNKVIKPIVDNSQKGNELKNVILLQDDQTGAIQVCFEREGGKADIFETTNEEISQYLGWAHGIRNGFLNVSLKKNVGLGSSALHRYLELNVSAGGSKK